MLTSDDIRSIESPYNTYKNKGLPPGAICSPGLAAITAAIYPADTDYYYFVSAKDKTTIFPEPMRSICARCRDCGEGSSSLPHIG